MSSLKIVRGIYEVRVITTPLAKLVKSESEYTLYGNFIEKMGKKIKKIKNSLNGWLVKIILPKKIPLPIPKTSHLSHQ